MVSELTDFHQNGFLKWWRGSRIFSSWAGPAPPKSNTTAGFASHQNPPMHFRVNTALTYLAMARGRNAGVSRGSNFFWSATSSKLKPNQRPESVAPEEFRNGAYLIRQPLKPAVSTGPALGGTPSSPVARRRRVGPQRHAVRDRTDRVGATRVALGAN